jgi:Protein of unknown function (DUF2490)
MQKKYFYLLLLCLGFSQMLAAQSATTSRVNDAEMWNSVFIHKEVSPGWSFTINPQFRADQNISAMKTIIFSTAINYKANSWYTFSPSFRYSLRPQWVSTIRIFADNVFKNWIGNSNFQWHFRMRLQTERLADQNSPWVYTARFRPHLIWKPQRKKWEFMLLSFEAYFSNNTNANFGYNRFRISAGLGYEFGKKCKLNINYIAQSQPFNPTAELDHITQLVLVYNFSRKKTISNLKTIAKTETNTK